MLIRNFEYVIWNRFFHKLSVDRFERNRLATWPSRGMAPADDET
jgi:hypothetical protein